jgi:hypothetical protein
MPSWPIHPSADPAPAAAEPDPRFTFEYRPLDDVDYRLDADQREMTYWDVEPLCRGPEPVPDWLVVDRAAIDTDQNAPTKSLRGRGVLKTGKEADAVLLRRALPRTQGCVLVAKRYRSAEHRLFQRAAVYTEGGPSAMPVMPVRSAARPRTGARSPRPDGRPPNGTGCNGAGAPVCRCRTRSSSTGPRS